MRLQDIKITQLREAKKISKQALADVMYCDVSKVNNVEKGVGHYPEWHIKYAQRFFDIENMPLSEFDVAVVKKRLYLMRDYVRDRRFGEAKALCEEMAKLVNLEACDDDLPLLYRLLEVIVLIQSGSDVDIAEEKMGYFQDKMDKLTDEHKYYYYFNVATLHFMRTRYNESLSFYKQALEIGSNNRDFVPDDIERVHLGIAACHTNLEFPNRALFYLRNTRELYVNKKTSALSLHLDNLLALNYIRVNELEEAQKILDNCLVCAKSIKDDYFYGWALHSYGVLYKQAEKWDKAIAYLNKAMECQKEGSIIYLKALFEQVYCWAMKKKFVRAKRLMEKTKSSYNNNKVFHIPFESLDHYVTLKSRISIYNDELAEYIETKAIKHFEETCDYFIAIDYYKLLEAYFVEKNKKKSLLMSEAIRKIYERCFVYGEGRDI